MSTLCQQIKSDYERLQFLTDRFLLEYEKVKNNSDRTALKRFKSEWEFVRYEMETKMFVSIAEARKMLGEEMVLGPEEINNAFGFEVEELEIPPIPYSREELEKAKELGEQLILRVSHDGEGNPMTMKRINEIKELRMNQNTGNQFLKNIDDYKDEVFYKNESLKTEWKLVGNSLVVEASPPTDKYEEDRWKWYSNYLHQTRLLRKYLKSIGALTEDEEKESSDSVLRKLSEQMGIDFDGHDERRGRNHRDVGRQLVKLQINQNHIRSATEIIYDLILRFDKTKDRSLFLEEISEWSRSSAFCGDLVEVNSFSGSGEFTGVLVNNTKPVWLGVHIGVVSQR